jgi:hypothetical protein
VASLGGECAPVRCKKNSSKDKTTKQMNQKYVRNFLPPASGLKLRTVSYETKRNVGSDLIVNTTSKHIRPSATGTESGSTETFIKIQHKKTFVIQKDNFAV